MQQQFLVTAAAHSVKQKEQLQQQMKQQEELQHQQVQRLEQRLELLEQEMPQQEQRLQVAVNDLAQKTATEQYWNEDRMTSYQKQLNEAFGEWFG